MNWLLRKAMEDISGFESIYEWHWPESKDPNKAADNIFQHNGRQWAEEISKLSTLDKDSSEFVDGMRKIQSEIHDSISRYVSKEVELERIDTSNVEPRISSIKHNLIEFLKDTKPIDKLELKDSLSSYLE